MPRLSPRSLLDAVVKSARHAAARGPSSGAAPTAPTATTPPSGLAATLRPPSSWHSQLPSLRCSRFVPSTAGKPTPPLSLLPSTPISRHSPFCVTPTVSAHARPAVPQPPPASSIPPLRQRLGPTSIYPSPLPSLLTNPPRPSSPPSSPPRPPPRQPQQLRSVTYGSEYHPSQRKRKRKHGFLARLRTNRGRKILARRKAKGKRFLSH